MTKKSKNIETTLSEKVYVIYDTELGIYEKPFVCKPHELSDILEMLVHNPESKYFNDPNRYDVYDIGDFDSDSGQISPYPRDFVNNLWNYRDEYKYRIQVCIQTLNFLPTGYYKMSKEEQKPIQDKIDKAISEYTELFIKDNPNLLSTFTPNGVNDN